MKKSLFTFLCLAAALSFMMISCKSGGNKQNIKKGKPLALVLEGTIKGFVDTEGSLVIDLSNYINAIPFSEGLAAVKNGDSKWGFINTKGDEVLPCVFDCDDDGSDWREALMFHDGYANMAGLGLIDSKGHWVIQHPYISDWNKEVVIVSDKYHSEYLLHDFKGNQISKQEYENLRICDNGMVLCQTRNGWGYLNSKGQTVVEPQYEEAYLYEDGVALVVDKDNNAMLIDEKGKVIKSLDYLPSLRGDCFDKNFHEGFAVAESEDEFEGHCMFVNSNYEPQFNKVFYRVSDFHDGYAAVQDPETELWGFIDSKGNYVIEPRYKGHEAVTCDDGYGIVQGDWGKLIVVNIKKGTHIMVPSAVCNIIAKRMWVFKSNVRDANGYHYRLWGIVTSDGQEIMPLSQYKVYDFHYTETDNSASLINK